MTGISCKSEYSWVFETVITLWLALLTIITFQKIYWLSGLFRSLKKLICFPFYGNDETWTQNTLISWKRLKQTGIYGQNIFFPLEIKGIWVGILSKFTIHGSCEISEDILYLYDCTSHFVRVCASLSLIFHLIWEIWFNITSTTKKNLVISIIRI